MLKAFGVGVLAASSLLLGALIALRFTIKERVLGWIMAFGAGVLLSAVAYDLVAEALRTSGGSGIPLGLACGTLTFFVGDLLLIAKGGGDRKSPRGEQSGEAPLAIVLGSVLDGVPESLVLGISLLTQDHVSVAVLVAVFLSNLPEGMAATSGMLAVGYSRAHILWMWAGVALVSGTAAALGFGLLEGASPTLLAFVNAFAAGAILTMLADTMMPEAYEHGGPASGLATSFGFLVAFLIATIEYR
jgi:zinc transporter, ZIP family